MGAGDNKTLPERARAEALAEWVLSFRDDAEENEGYGAFYVRGDKTLHGGDPRHYLPTHPFPDSPFKADLRVLCTVYLAAEARVEAVEAENAELRAGGDRLAAVAVAQATTCVCGSHNDERTGDERKHGATAPEADTATEGVGRVAAPSPRRTGEVPATEAVDATVQQVGGEALAARVVALTDALRRAAYVTQNLLERAGGFTGVIGPGGEREDDYIAESLADEIASWAVLASSVKQGQEGLGGSRSASAVAEAGVGSGLRLDPDDPDEYVFLNEDPVRIFCVTNSDTSPNERSARARLVVEAVNAYIASTQTALPSPSTPGEGSA